ncbi:MAG TPA: DUF6485 family protein [archaeon]|nr:DUF6485 family protein [archaeon]
MECKKASNAKNCSCTYACEKKGLCCECIVYHRKRNEIPACFFSKSAEKTFDRSIGFFIESGGK